MPRLIDADKLKADFIGKRYGTQAIEYVIDQQPTVDAKPVVRCKDCRWGSRYDEDLIECPLDLNNPPEYHDCDWYCPNGTRREDGRGEG